MNRFAFILLIVLCACANEVNVLDPAPSKPVVYGLLSPQDSVHRVRLTRTFIADGNLDSVALLPDSLYFKSAEVYLELRTPDGYVIDRNRMEPVNAADKDEGLFLRNPNRVFQCLPFPTLAITSYSDIYYVLTITIPEQNLTAIARSHIPRVPGLGLPVSLNNRTKINLYDEKRNKIGIGHSQTEYSEFQMIFRYSEYRWDEWVDAQFVYSVKLQPGTVPSYLEGPSGQSEAIYIFVDAPFMYELVANRIKVDPQVAMRKFYNIEFRMITADPGYWEYTNSFDYLTDFNAVNYTNITNGYGLFSVYRVSKIPPYGLSWQSLDSLCNGVVTRHLNFKSW